MKRTVLIQRLYALTFYLRDTRVTRHHVALYAVFLQCWQFFAYAYDAVGSLAMALNRTACQTTADDLSTCNLTTLMNEISSVQFPGTSVCHCISFHHPIIHVFQVTHLSDPFRVFICRVWWRSMHTVAVPMLMSSFYNTDKAKVAITIYSSCFVVSPAWDACTYLTCFPFTVQSLIIITDGLVTAAVAVYTDQDIMLLGSESVATIWPGKLKAYFHVRVCSKLYRIMLSVLANSD